CIGCALRVEPGGGQQLRKNVTSGARHARPGRITRGGVSPPNLRGKRVRRFRLFPRGPPPPPKPPKRTRSPPAPPPPPQRTRGWPGVKVGRFQPSLLNACWIFALSASTSR